MLYIEAMLHHLKQIKSKGKFYYDLLYVHNRDLMKLVQDRWKRG